MDDLLSRLSMAKDKITDTEDLISIDLDHRSEFLRQNNFQLHQCTHAKPYNLTCPYSLINYLLIPFALHDLNICYGII